MNELEREIEENLNEILVNDENLYSMIDDFSYKLGANFILEKNLDEQFAEWITDNFKKTHYGWILKNDNNIVGGFVFENEGITAYYSIKYIKTYWLNNVYGK